LFLKKDNFKLGLALGFLLPFLVFIGIYLVRFSFYSFSEFLAVVQTENRLITFFGTWCMIGNIALFTIYINTNRFATAKGIFAVTLVYGILILLLKVLN
jgi:uncharacterized membrane protein YhhN